MTKVEIIKKWTKEIEMWESRCYSQGEDFMDGQQCGRIDELKKCIEDLKKLKVSKK